MIENMKSGNLDDRTELILHDRIKKDLQYYERLLGNGSELIVILDKNGNLKYNSSNIKEILGYDESELIGSNVFEYIHQDDYKDIIGVFKRAKPLPRKSQNVFFRIRHKNSTWRYFRSKGMNLLSDPRITGILVNSIDITAQVNAEKDLKKSEARFNLISKESIEGIWEWEISSDKLFWSDRLKELIGRKDNCEINSLMHLKNLIYFKDRDLFVKSLWNHIHNRSPFDVEVRIKNKEGNYGHFRLRGGVQRDNSGMPLYMAGFISDITQFKKLLLRDKFFESHDPLTKLPNKFLLLKMITGFIHEVKSGKQKIFSLALIDINNLNNIETISGVEYKEELIRSFVSRIKRTFNKSTTLARISESEFGLLFENSGNLESKNDCDNIQTTLSTPFNILGQQAYLNCSMGLSEYNQDITSELLIRNSSLALYRAKNQGSMNCEIFNNEMYNDALYLHQLEMDLRTALDKNEFELYYQPIANLSTGKVTGFEALIRWNHPKFGMLYPADFIWLAEETDAILPMGEWVLNTACRQIIKWKEKFDEPLKVSINFSAKQFKSKKILTVIQDVLDMNNVKPEDLQIEITETVAMEDTEQNKNTLKDLEKMGIYVSIDDFGIGYSSLEMLKKFDLHTLKIDRSFVQGVGEVSKDSKIVSSIISMARNLDLKIIAEGVENSQQLEFLKANNCDEIQGFYLSRPLSVTKAEIFLKKHQRKPVFQHS